MNLRVIYSLLTLLTIVACVWLGGFCVWEQYRKNTTFVPVAGMVDARSIEPYTSKRNGEEWTSYRPTVGYFFDVNGRQYYSNFITPNLPLSFVTQFNSEAEARERIAGWQVGDKVTAYYNPTDPADAYLVQSYTFFPYIALLISLAWIPCLPVFPMMHPTHEFVADQQRPGWYVLSGITSRRFFLLSAVATFAWIVSIGAVTLDYMRVSGRGPEDVGFLIGAALWGLFISGGMMFVSRDALTLGLLTIRKYGSQHMLGETVRVEFQQTVRSFASLRGMKVILRCALGRDRPPIFERCIDVPISELKRVGNTFEGHAEFQLPALDPANEARKRIILGKPPPSRWRLVTVSCVQRWGSGARSFPLKVVTPNSDRVSSTGSNSP